MTALCLGRATSTAPAPARAADGPSIAVQQWGGAVTGVAADGDTAYVAIGPRLAVVDVADTAAPRLLGQSEPVDDIVTHPFLFGNRVYALGVTRGLFVFDVADPAVPRLVDTLPALGFSWDLDVVDGVAFACDDKGGVRIIDLRAPAGPVVVGTWTPLTGKAGTAAAFGPYVFVGVAGEPSALVVLNARATPPVEVARFEFEGGETARDIAIHQDWAYVALSSVASFDITDPEAPVFVPSTDDETDTLDALFATEDVLWAVSTSSAYALDVRDPEAITKRSVFSLDNNLEPSIVVDGTRAYVGDTNGLRIVEIGNPLLDPIASSGLPDDGPGGAGADVLDIAQKDGFVLVASGAGGLRILDGRGTIAATEVARLPAVPGAAPNDGTTAVTVAGDRAYTAEGGLGSGLRVVDIADPTRPRDVASVAAPGAAGRPAVAGDLVAVPTSSASVSGVTIYRIAPDGQPILLSTLGVRAQCTTATLDGTRLYLGGDGLFIVDIADPTAPVLLGALPQVDLWDGIIQIAPDRLAVADLGLGLLEVDIADTAAPAIVARHPMTGGALAVARFGEDLWVTNDYAGVTRMALAPDGGLRVVGQWYVGQQIHRVAPGASRIWLTGFDHIVALDAAAPSMPWLAGTLASPGVLVRAAVEGDRIATLSSWDLDQRSIHILADGAPPGFLGTAPLGPFGRDLHGPFGDLYVPGGALALESGVAWAPAGGFGVTGYDARDPSAIRRLTAYRGGLALSLYHVVVVGSTAVGLSDDDALVVLDLSDPLRPAEVGRASVQPGSSFALASDGKTAWLLVDGRDGTTVAAYDIAVPSFISDLGRWLLPEEAYDLALEGDRLAIAAGTDGLLVWDVADPQAPAPLAQLPIDERLEAVALANGVAWTVGWAAMHFRASAVDLDAAGGPKVVDSALVADWHEVDIAADGWTAALANGNAGLYVLHLVDPPVRPTPSPTAVSPTAVPTATPTPPGRRLYFPSALVHRPTARVAIALDRSAAMAAPITAASAPGRPNATRFDIARRMAEHLAAGLGARGVEVTLIAYDAQAERLPSSGAAAVTAALAGLTVAPGASLAATARHDVALAAAAADLVAAPLRCRAAIVLTAGRSAGGPADAVAVARSRELAARGIATFVARIGIATASDDGWLAMLAGESGRLIGVASEMDGESGAARLVDTLATCP